MTKKVVLSNSRLQKMAFAFCCVVARRQPRLRFHCTTAAGRGIMMRTSGVAGATSEAQAVRQIKTTTSMYFPDLGTSTQIAFGAHVRAIGWLDDVHPYKKGRVAADVARQIRDFTGRWEQSVTALGWPVVGGFHICELCGLARGSGNLGVPSGDLLFVCPELVSHYVDTHAYCPPQEFLDAVVHAPLPGTSDYLDKVAAFPKWLPDEL